jgi:hypothetical protein
LLLLMYSLSAFQKWLKFLWKVFFKNGQSFMLIVLHVQKTWFNYYIIIWYLFPFLL